MMAGPSGVKSRDNEDLSESRKITSMGCYYSM